MWREPFHEITHCCGYKPCARAADSRDGCLARRDSVGGYVATELIFTVAGPDGAGLPRSHSRRESLLPIALDGTDGVPPIAALLSPACHRGARCLRVELLAIQDGSWNGTN